MDFVCILNGWIFIFERPGVAAMRCFRVLRLLWLHKFPVVFISAKCIVEAFVNITGFESARDILGYGFDVMEFAELALRALTAELFFLSEHTRGGFLLMSLLFYASYIMGAVMWQEFPGGDPGNNEPCATLAECHFTMIRLTLFDGAGFDYAFSLAPKHRYLFFLVMVYMCVTSFGIINGLLGIFSKSFNKASSDAFHHKNRPVSDGADDDDAAQETPYTSGEAVQGMVSIKSSDTRLMKMPSFTSDEGGENIEMLAGVFQDEMKVQAKVVKKMQDLLFEQNEKIIRCVEQFDSRLTQMQRQIDDIRNAS